MRSIPDFAAVNETVKLARNSGERAFVNALLRGAVRSKSTLPLPDRKKNAARFLSVKYSFPLHTVKLFISLYGEEECERLLVTFNESKYTDVTVNTLKTTPDALISALGKQGITATPDECLGNSLRILGSFNPERAEGFSQGDFFVQDRASLISAAALSPKANELIIDTCSCPGGKSFAAAILSGDKARIYSYDLHESKLSLVTEGAARLGLASISADAVDALVGNPELFGKADKVICDAPCSGLGVLGKKPDLRYKSRDAVDELPELQGEILKTSAKYLKVGGELVYSTCTLNPKENEEVVDLFLRENRNFAPSDFTAGVYASKNGSLTLTPVRDGTDGFFMAKIVRVK
jgi:16S rRNA (cytosine967-C5)-methyltransferase